MHEWLFYSVLIMLGLLGIVVALRPFWHARRLVLMLAPVLCVSLVLAYGVWGGFFEWHAFHLAEAKQKQAEAVVQSLGSTKAIIERFEAYLKKSPNDPKAWFLLGRVYVAESDWSHANQAFATAHRLAPADEEYTLHYVQSVWELNHQHFDEASRALLLGILKHHPEQPDALAMLALDAYKQHEDRLAVMYWERLLKLAPQGSEEASKLRQAIAKARMRIKS
jgi:cytochrome c-type biogenesis protein CcmH/NrfG